MYLPVVVDILFEDVPQEHLLDLQAFLITKSSSSVPECIVPLVYWMDDDGTWR
jgi:hypothetical protein